jgi:hypothetical protein
VDTQSRRLRLSVAGRRPPDPNSYTYAKCDANTYSDTNGDTYRYTKCNADSYTDTHPCTQGDTAATADPASSSHTAVDNNASPLVAGIGCTWGR